MSPSLASALAVLRIETRRGVVLFLSPLILAAAWFMSWYGMYGTMPRDIYLWQETSRVVKDSILTVGPLVAGLSAWAAGRNRRRGMGDLLSTTARPAASRDLLTWAGVALPCVAVYAGLIVVLGIPTSLNSTWGAPLPGYLLIGLVALLMDSALGFAAGYYLPGRFTAPLVAVALYVGHLLPMGAADYKTSVALLSPAAYSNLIGADVFYEYPRIALPQTLLFGGLCGAALAAVVLKGNGESRAVRMALALALVAAAGGLFTALSKENPYGLSAGEPEAASFEYLCEEGGITVCVHPAYEKFLPEAAGTVNEVAEPLVGIPGAPTRALQVNGPETMPADANARNVAFFGTFDPWGKLYEEDVAYGLVQRDPGMRYGPNTPNQAEFTKEDLRRCGDIRYREYFDSAYAAQIIVGRWLTERAGGRVAEMSGGCPNSKELVERFAALDTAKRESWLRENLADLRVGKITLEDLP